MVFDLPFYHQNAHVNIIFLVVDDDPISLSIIHNMLKTDQTYKDKSYGEIKVLTTKNSSEAVSTLRGQCNNIDVVITDYHIPGLNGLQLKKRIDEEFRNLPVIDPGNINADGLNKRWMENSTINSDANKSRQVTRKKPKLKWTNPLQHKFNQSIKHIGLHKATPKMILEFMKGEGLKRSHIASHLQKYRGSLKSIKEKAWELQKATRFMNSSFLSSSYIDPQDSYNNSPMLCNNTVFNSQLGYGPLGQSSLMMNNNDPYMNQLPIYNLSQAGSNLLPMEGRLGVSNGMLPIEGSLGVSSGMLPMQGSLGFSSGMLPMEGSLGFSSGMFPLNEERRSTFGTSQAPQVPRFGQYGTTNDALGMNSNLSTGYMMSNYAGIRVNENGDLLAPGGRRVNVNGNGSLGGNLDAMNWNFNNNNMSNHGSSNPMFSSAFPSFLDNEYHQSHNNLTAQMDDVVPVLENPNIYNDDHHGINEVFHGTVNSQYVQNQQQGNVTGENLELPNYDLLERNAILAPYPFEDISNWGFDDEPETAEVQELLSTFGPDWEARGVL